MEIETNRSIYDVMSILSLFAHSILKIFLSVLEGWLCFNDTAKVDKEMTRESGWYRLILPRSWDLHLANLKFPV